MLSKGVGIRLGGRELSISKRRLHGLIHFFLQNKIYVDFDEKVPVREGSKL